MHKRVLRSTTLERIVENLVVNIRNESGPRDLGRVISAIHLQSLLQRVSFLQVNVRTRHVHWKIPSCSEHFTSWVTD